MSSEHARAALETMYKAAGYGGYNCVLEKATVLEYMDRLEARRLRYSLGIKGAIGDDRAKRNTGEPARSDVSEIHALRADKRIRKLLGSLGEEKVLP